MSDSPKPLQQAGEPVDKYRARLKAWENGTQSKEEELKDQIAADEAALAELQKQETQA